MLDGLHQTDSQTDAKSFLLVLSGLLASCACAVPAAQSQPMVDEDEEEEEEEGSDSENTSNVNGSEKQARATRRAWHALVVEMAEGAATLLGADDGHVVYCAFQVLHRACNILSVNRTVLFPLLHRVWPDVIPRLKVASMSLPSSTHARVAMNGALELVCALLTDVRCSDFLRHRFVESVWPALRGVLAAGCPWAKAATVVDVSSLHLPSWDTVTSQALSVAQSADDRIVSQVLTTCASLSASDVTCCMIRAVVWEVCCACVPYLSSSVSPLLQDHGHRVFVELWSVDSPAVWLFLSRIAPVSGSLSVSPPPDVSWLPAPTVGCTSSQQSLKWTGHSGLTTGHLHKQVTLLLSSLAPQ